MGSETQDDASAAAGPVRVRVDRDSHPDPAARARAWREATSVSMDTAVEPGDLEAFAGSVGVHPVGPFLVVDLCLGPATLLRSQSVRAEWEHDHVIADCVVSGRVRGQIGGRAVDAGPGDCLMVDLKGAMHVRVADGTRILGLIMPRVVFEAATGEPGTVDGVVFAAASPAGAVLGGLLTSLAAQVDRLPDRAALALARAVVAVSAAFTVPVSVAAVGGDPDRPPVALPTLAQLRRFIDREAARPELGIESLCAQFGLSRTMLYRVFAPAGGVAAVIRQRRASLAVDLLTRLDASGLTVAEVARASGFGTERSLRNALHELYGATPRTIMRDGLVAERRNEVSAAEIGRLFDDL